MTSTSSTRQVILVRAPREEVTTDDFGIEEVDLPPLGPGELLVANHYMSVDPSTRGRLEATEKHYTTNFSVGDPLDGHAIGTVIGSNADAFPVGSTVHHRLGWREHAIVAAEAAQIMDPKVAPLPTWLGLLGQTGFTAYAGLRAVAELREGEVVLVSAAAGAVGSACGQLARKLGASRVIGIAGSAEKCEALVGDFGFDVAIDRREQDLEEALKDAAPGGVDVYFDNVGGDHLVAALHAMNVGGRVALCGMISQFGASDQCSDINHLIQAVLKRITLRGFIVRDHEELREEFQALVTASLADGSMVARETILDGLEAAPEALLGMMSGANVGKMLVRLLPEPESTS
jgi:NADPH-dependent curcumin reductase CurA